MIMCLGLSTLALLIWLKGCNCFCFSYFVCYVALLSPIRALRVRSVSSDPSRTLIVGFRSDSEVFDSFCPELFDSRFSTRDRLDSADPGQPSSASTPSAPRTHLRETHYLCGAECGGG